MATKEISWGKAFGYALRYIAYTILWGIIGLLMIGVGVSMAIMRGGSEEIIGIIVAIVGAVILTLGGMATYFKIMSRLISETTS